MAARMTKKARRNAALKGWRNRTKRNAPRRRNAGQSGSNNSPTRTRTATSTHATTTGNKTGTSTGGAVSGGGGNITVSVKRNPPSGWMPCSAVRIVKKGKRTEVHVRRVGKARNPSGLGGVVRSAVIREYSGSPSVTIRLRLDSDGRYRWFEQGGGDTEVSGRTIAAAVKTARAAWRSWDFRLKAKR